jgi:hypothetical protein
VLTECCSVVAWVAVLAAKVTEASAKAKSTTPRISPSRRCTSFTVGTKALYYL